MNENNIVFTKQTANKNLLVSSKFTTPNGVALRITQITKTKWSVTKLKKNPEISVIFTGTGPTFPPSPNSSVSTYRFLGDIWDKISGLAGGAASIAKDLVKGCKPKTVTTLTVNIKTGVVTQTTTTTCIE